MKKRALISVSDKTGVVEFARGLASLDWELVSTGGTAQSLRAAGLVVLDVSDLTKHPEMMEGRVKTLHPAVHAGLLARRDNPEDMKALAAQGYAAIDLVCVNLYPFHKAIAGRATLNEATSLIDVGGPTMLRAAAKNYVSVFVVVDAADYSRVLDAVRSPDASLDLRAELAAKVFAHTALYDAAIAGYFGARGSTAGDGEFPPALLLTFRHAQALRYGENPDQAAAFYAEPHAPPGSMPHMHQLQGKELSFNNLLDVDAAVSAVSAWHDATEPVCVIVKHTTPCGVALGESTHDAWQRALACDPVSAFGGIVAFNRPIDGETATALAGLFLEIVIAPSFDADARELLVKKKNLRLIELPLAPVTDGELDYKRVRGGLLVQQRMRMHFDEQSWKVVTRRAPGSAESEDLRFAWRVAASVKSNAIVLARQARTLGIGAGQMSRVDAARLAVLKASDQKADLRGAALASDAFFPFRDGIDAAAEQGVAAVIQPGGSVRDDEVIAAANEHGMAMVFTGRRVFRH